jgi:hypothetical protein
MDRDRHEKGLEGDLSVREALNLRGCSKTLYAKGIIAKSCWKWPFALCILWFYVIFRTHPLTIIGKEDAFRHFSFNESAVQQSVSVPAI